MPFIIFWSVSKAVRCAALLYQWSACESTGVCVLTKEDADRSLYHISVLTTLLQDLAMYVMMICIGKGLGFSRPLLLTKDRQRIITSCVAYSVSLLLWRMASWLFLFLVAITTCILLFNVITSCSKTVMWLRMAAVRISPVIRIYFERFTTFRNGLLIMFAVDVVCMLFGAVVTPKEIVPIARVQIRDVLLLVYTLVFMKSFGT